MIHHSIIIPTAGRPNSVKIAVESVLEQKLKSIGTELIVVDNNSDPSLVRDLAAYCNALKNKLRYFHEPSPGLTSARHKGVSVAHGEILSFIDDDVELSDTWLEAIQKEFRKPDLVLIGGPSVPKFTGSIPAWFWDFVLPTPYGGWMNPWLSLLDIGRDINNIDPNYIWGLNFSIRKNVLFELGGFYPDLVPKHLQRWQGDGETGLTMKIKDYGLRAAYVQDALLLHLCGSDRLTVEYFEKRAFYQGVCNSFTQIRSENLTHSNNPSFYDSVRSMVGRLFRKIRPKTLVWSNEAKAVRELTNKAEIDGWNFHQNQVKNDPALLAWVLRQDYFDTDLGIESGIY